MKKHIGRNKTDNQILLAQKLAELDEKMLQCHKTLKEIKQLYIKVLEKGER